MSLKNGDHFGEKPLGYRFEIPKTSLLDRFRSNEEWFIFQEQISNTDEHLLVAHGYKFPRKFRGRVVSIKPDEIILRQGERLIDFHPREVINVIPVDLIAESFDPRVFGY
jgi:hypothetical protein